MSRSVRRTNIRRFVRVLRLRRSAPRNAPTFHQLVASNASDAPRTDVGPGPSGRPLFRTRIGSDRPVGRTTSHQSDLGNEINPGDNIEPNVGNLALLAFDDRSFYAAFEFADPDPSSIRAPLGDRDNVPGFTDYGGVILDTRNHGHSAMMMLANARGT